MISNFMDKAKAVRLPEGPTVQNIELKAIYPDIEKARRRAAKIGAVRRGLLVQTDTYFLVRFGRLKLREFKDQTQGELIAYSRDDEATARASDYEIVPISDPTRLRRALGKTLGIRAIVRKVRELWMLENVRIHLDEVAHLGNFIEFEAVLNDASESREGSEKVAMLVRQFEIAPGDVQKFSYADLLMRAAG